jgi:hypothetical protein
MTKQERPITFYVVDRVERTPDGYRLVHEPVTESGTDG